MQNRQQAANLVEGQVFLRWVPHGGHPVNYRRVIYH